VNDWPSVSTARDRLRPLLRAPIAEGTRSLPPPLRSAGKLPCASGRRRIPAPMSLQERILGCPVGGAIGDAVGGVPERGELSLSDNTQLTLATCEALQAGRVSLEEIAAAFVRWCRAGAVTGVGSSTLKALRDLSVGAHWALSGARQWRRDADRSRARSSDYLGALAVVLPFAGARILRTPCRTAAPGYVVETVPRALFLARRMTAELFAGRVGRAGAGRRAGIPDTIGSIADQVAGARLDRLRLPRTSSLAPSRR
jgi:hypothetical protein